jgi:hypothetical protein
MFHALKLKDIVTGLVWVTLRYLKAKCWQNQIKPASALALFFTKFHHVGSIYLSANNLNIISSNKKVYEGWWNGIWIGELFMLTE